MIVTEMKPEHFQKVKQLHKAMAMPYQFPRLSDELVHIKDIVLDEKGCIIAAGAVKIYGEAFLWIDPERSVNERLSAVMSLEMEMRHKAKREGFEQICAEIPPSVGPAFLHLLRDIGWIKSNWPVYSRVL